MLVSYKTIGRNIRQYRVAAHMTQEQTAEALGISQLHFGRLERGERPASLEQLARIAGTLHVSTFALLRGSILEEHYTEEADEDIQAFSAAAAHLAEAASPQARRLMLDVCRTIVAHDRVTDADI